MAPDPKFSLSTLNSLVAQEVSDLIDIYPIKDGLGSYSAIREEFLATTPTSMTTPTVSPTEHACNLLNFDDRSLSQGQIYRGIDKGKPEIYIPPRFQTAKHLEDIVKLTRDLIALRPSQCAPGAKPIERFGHALDQRLQNSMQLMPEQLQGHFPKHRFHPYIDLFMRCAASEGIFAWAQMAGTLTSTEHKKYGTARQGMLAAIRTAAREPAFYKKVKSHRDKVRRNFKCIQQYTDAQFDCHSRLLVIRVDCDFVENFSPAHDWAQARIYREKLIKFFNRDLPKLIQPQKNRDTKKKQKSIAGYLIGTEYGIETGWHFHVTLFLNGNDFSNDVGIASAICGAWMQDISKGKGRYYNCNQAARKGRYTEVGVGMIHRHDLAKREILHREVTRYGCKGCYYAEAQTGTKDRLLNKGGWPKVKDPSKGGRPESPPQMQGGFLRQEFSEKQRRFFSRWIPDEPLQPPVDY